MCKDCRRCARVCPSAVFSVSFNGIKIENDSRCIGCGHCVDVCADGAISHTDFPQSKVHRVQRDIYPTAESLLALIRGRRSNRTLTDKPIPQEILDDIIEAARYAPTAENSRRVVLTMLEEKEIRRLEDTVMRFFLRLSSILMHPILRPLTKALLPDLYREAPELERFRVRWENGELPCSCNCNRMLIISAPRSYDFGYQDCNLAYQNASLVAEAHGISQIYMGLIQTALKFMPSRKVRSLLNLPAGHQPYALMALGIPAFHYRNYTER